MPFPLHGILVTADTFRALTFARHYFKHVPHMNSFNLHNNQWGKHHSFTDHSGYPVPWSPLSHSHLSIARFLSKAEELNVASEPQWSADPPAVARSQLSPAGGNEVFWWTGMALCVTPARTHMTPGKLQAWRAEGCGQRNARLLGPGCGSGLLRQHYGIGKEGRSLDWWYWWWWWWWWYLLLSIY